MASVTANAHFWTALRTWWTADVSGVILIAPVILAMGIRSERRVSWSPSRLGEGVALLAGAAIGSWWIFLVPHAEFGPFTQPFPMLAFLVWAAIRFGVPGSTWTMLLISSFCVWTGLARPILHQKERRVGQRPGILVVDDDRGSRPDGSGHAGP